MAEKTTNTTTEESVNYAEKYKHCYFISNDDVPFSYAPANFDFPNSGDTWYPFIKTAPDEGMQNPKFDWKNHKWFSNTAQTYAEQVAKVQKNVDKVAEQVNDLQTEQQTAAKNDEKSQQNMTQIQSMTAQSTAMMQQIMTQLQQQGQAITQVANAVNKLQPVTSDTDKADEDAKTTEATNAKEVE